LGNVVAITGDSHLNAVRNVPGSFRSMDSPPVATEFIGTSISTDGDEDVGPVFGGNPENPHHLFRDIHRGYVSVVAEPQQWTSEFRRVDTVLQPQSTASTIAKFAVDQGSPGAHRL
jgi:alkaline phosphatase D